LRRICPLETITYLTCEFRQLAVAQVTGVSANRVVVRVKRLGGGFRGKDTRSIPLASVCAVAAKKLKRPVRCALNREQDIVSTGQRHPFYSEWKAWVRDDDKYKGNIVALTADIYANAGWSRDLSSSICFRAMTHVIIAITFHTRISRNRGSRDRGCRGFRHQT
jgi:xanthine dehydrogenase/oxidase